MNDEENNDAAQGAADLGNLADFFAPSWAKEGQEGNVRLVSGGDGRSPRRSDFDREDRPRRDRDGERRDRPPRREGQGFERRDRPPRREGEDFERRDFRRDREGGEGRRDFNRRGPRPERPAPEAPLALAVRFLPEGKALDAIIRRIQATRKAYPFRDIVRLFQKDDASLSVRIEADKSANPDGKVFQCRLCGMPALSEAEVAEHLFSKHMADYFDVETVEGEAPAGNFPCVARCGLSGELLGPPNHHSYAQRVAEVLHDRFPGMSREEYGRHIEMVRDPEVVEQWREAAKKRTLFFRKQEVAAAPAEEQPKAGGAAEPAAESASGEESKAEAASERIGIPRAEAEMIFRRDIMPGQIGCAPHVVCAATTLKDMPNRRLAAFLNREFSHDDALRSQGSLSKALHAAFHHRKLHFFHANDEHGQEFVTFGPPVKLDTENVTDEIRSIAAFIEANPSCPQKTLVEAMVPDGNEESVKKVVSSIRWLIEKGHLVEFFNGFISPAAAHPVFSTAKKKVAKPASAAAETSADDRVAESGVTVPEAQPVESAAEVAAEAQPAADVPAEAVPAEVAEPVAEVASAEVKAEAAPAEVAEPKVEIQEEKKDEVQ